MILPVQGTTAVASDVIVMSGMHNIPLALKGLKFVEVFNHIMYT